MATHNPDLHRPSAVQVAQEEDFAIWLASDEAVKLIGGEDRNHVDTANAAFLAGWKAALHFAYLNTDDKGNQA